MKGAAMTITLEVPPDMEAKLREYMAKHDAGEAQRDLDAAFARALAFVLTKDQPDLSLEEFDALMDELGDEWEADGGPENVFLSDEAVSREGIYGDHL